MRYLIFSCLLFLNTSFLDAINYYQKGDQLFVWAKSGLVLRNAADFKAPKITSISFGSTVIMQLDRNDGLDDKTPISLEVIKPIQLEEQDYPGYKIAGRWAKVKAGDKIGYVFDGYLSKYPTPKQDFMLTLDWDGYLENVFGLACNSNESANRFYKNGASIQTSPAGDGVSTTTILLPNLSLEEGYLILEAFYKLEKIVNTKSEGPDDGNLVLLESSKYKIDFEEINSSTVTAITVGCINGVVVITTLFAC